MKLKIIPSSIMASIFIAFGCMFSMRALNYGPVIQGLCFSVGLFGVVCTNATLFTGYITKLDYILKQNYRKDLIVEFVKNLIIIWIINLLTMIVMSELSILIGINGCLVASAKASSSIIELIIRGIFCNILVCFAVYMAKRTRTPVGKFFAVLMPVACFVCCGFEHSVANMYYMMFGFIFGTATFTEIFNVIVFSTIGNLIGGIIFVYLIYKSK